MNINQPSQGLNLNIPGVTKGHKKPVPITEQQLRLPFIHAIPDSIRNHFIAMCGEFVGTVLFLYFALSGAQVANSILSSAGKSVEETGPNPQQLQYIALCFGFSLAVNAWVFFRISGGLFNPAVTIGMCLIGALPWVRGILLFFTQIAGGIASAALVSCMFPGELNVRTTLGGGTSVVQGLFIEMILTAQLVFTIFMLAAEKHKSTFIAPVGIGLSLFIAELTGVYFTGGSLNPARSFGPAVVTHKFEKYHWIYWVGPILGALVAAGFYKFIKVLEYETANPGQDMDHETEVEKRREYLMLAGMDELDADHFATDLAHNASAWRDGDGTVDAKTPSNYAPGKTDGANDSFNAYGNQYRSNVENGGLDRSTSAALSTGSQVGSQAGKYSFLHRLGAHHESISAGNSAPNSAGPVPATHAQIDAPLVHGRDEALGGMINDTEARQRTGANVKPLQ